NNTNTTTHTNIIPPPPTSPITPYTTLFRSRQTDGAISARVLAGTRGRKPGDPEADARARDELLTSAKEQHEHDFAVQSVVTALRSEEHTSELQSRENLVCRLLLEKKKIIIS